MVRDDEDVESMFVSHGHFGFNYIELYILLHKSQQPQMFKQSEIFDQS